MENGKTDSWKDSEWYLPSYQKQMEASSFVEGNESKKAAKKDSVAALRTE